MELIAGGLDYHGLSNADVVVEAIVEIMDVKKSVLRETEQHVRAECVLATNTSSLSVDEMAGALERPERFCGMHFFNPVHRMPLVEVIRGSRTSDETVATVYALALRLGKVPVVVGDGPGFLVNRILGPYLNEAGFLLGDGATIADIDRVAKQFGMPMGPLRLIDEVGIDVSGHAGESLHAGLGDRLAPSPVLLALGRTDRLGRKGGSGFYRYEKGRDKGVDESVYDALASVVPPHRAIPDEDIRRRLVVAMINEAARILEDGIVQSARDVDLAMIMGTGFPPFRGGLLRFADTLHPRALLDRVRELEATHGTRFSPAPLIERLASGDRRFYDAYPGMVD
jgi:3-hydroxyacyl-CoA dehydrogenase/enoyl-CoA hydratase/3-hydroxybutyryl-CoA epimerase